jgi:hypothetical protein
MKALVSQRVSRSRRNVTVQHEVDQGAPSGASHESNMVAIQTRATKQGSKDASY